MTTHTREQLERTPVVAALNMFVGCVRAGDTEEAKLWRERLLSAIESLLRERDGLAACIGTVRELSGCKVRNVSDVSPEQHSQEILARFESLRTIAREKPGIAFCSHCGGRTDWPTTACLYPDRHGGW